MHRNSSIHSALAIVACLAATGIVSAGTWDDELAVTQDPILQYRSYATVAPDDTLYVLWPDWTDWEDSKAYLAKSPDKGATWSDPSLILDGAAFDDFQLLADDTGLHLLFVEFYEDDEGEYLYLYYAKSIDGGESFTDPIRVGTRDNVNMIKLMSSPGYLFIHVMVYIEDTPFNFLYVSDDGGTTWTEKPILPGATVQNPGFTVEDGVIHMVYGGFLVQPDILYSYTDDAGDTWSSPVAVSSGAGTHSQLPAIAVDDDDVVHVSWEDDREGHFNIMYSRSTDGGLTFSPDVRMNDTYYGARTKLLADEEGLHLVWCQYHGSGWPSSWSSGDYGIVWYKFSDDGGASFTDEFRVSQNGDIPPLDLPDMGANNVKFAEYSSGFCAFWQDKRDGNIDLYMRNSFPETCPADVTGDGVIDVLDLLEVLSQWGTSGSADVTGDGIVDVLDLLEVLSAWGPC